MKKLTLTSLLVILTLGFSSCTQEESTFLQEPSAEDLLKSFNLNKNSKGDYSLDYQLNNGASSSTEIDVKNNTNNIYLYSSENEAKSTQNERLDLQNGEFKISFKDTENENNNFSISVFDKDITTSKSENDNDFEFLDTFGITTNEDGTYTMNFSVNDNVAVDYVFDADNNIYEIHLSPGQSSQSDFTTNFTKEENESMEIAFVSGSNEEAKTVRPRKPVIIID